MWTKTALVVLMMGLLASSRSRAFTIAPKVTTGRVVRATSTKLFDATAARQATEPLSPRRGEMSSNDNPAPMTLRKLEYPVILFDGVCNFCNTWVDLLLRVDVNQRFKFAPLQSATGQQLLQAVGKDADDISSVVLIQPDLVSYDKSACVLQVVAELGPVARVAAVTARRMVPARFRDSIYDTVATNRYNLMGKRDECRCSDPKYSDRFLS